MLSVSDDNPDIQCFFPLQQIEFIKKFKIDQKQNVNFFYSNLISYDGYDKDFDFTRPILGFGTVVHWCIAMAVYMGFSEIYLLGCDNTGIVVNIKSMLKTNDDADYGYEVSENDKKRMEANLQNSSLEAYLDTYMLTIKDYRRLNEYCSRRKIKLVNCSSQTVIDSVPRMRLVDVLNNKAES